MVILYASKAEQLVNLDTSDQNHSKADEFINMIPKYKPGKRPINTIILNNLKFDEPRDRPSFQNNRRNGFMHQCNNRDIDIVLVILTMLLLISGAETGTLHN